MIIVSTPTTPPPLPGDPGSPPVVHGKTGFGFTLVDTNGVSWDLANGPVYALAGMTGVGAPDVDHWLREFAALNGSMHQGFRTPAREFDLPVEVREVNELDWLATDQKLWSGLDPAKDCNLLVTTPLGTTRYMPMRYGTGGHTELELDPMLEQMSVYPLGFTVPDPFWRGQTIVVAFEATNTTPFFPGPPFTLVPDNTIATAAVTNPGDQDAYARWVIDGPYTDATVGLGSTVVTFDVPILAGERRIVDMDPNLRVITDGNGTDKWLDAAEAEFAAIPPGEDIPLSLEVNGSGLGTRIELSFVPRYRRAW